MAKKTILALVRHGQSEWNLQNRFTGWVDVDLTERGESEAQKAGRLLKALDVEFSRAFTSVQKRAIRTLWLALTQMDRMWLPVTKDWHLNERHYGGLTGLDKAETAKIHGEEQVKIWRRSYDISPPSMPDDHSHNPNHGPQYAHLDAHQLPSAESLKTTLERVAPFWHSEILPLLLAKQSIVISAHGNSLRALVKLLLDVDDDDILRVEIPTGNPLVFSFDAADLANKKLSVDHVNYLDTERAQPLPPLP